MAAKWIKISEFSSTDKIKITKTHGIDKAVVLGEYIKVEYDGKFSGSIDFLTEDGHTKTVIIDNGLSYSLDDSMYEDFMEDHDLTPLLDGLGDSNGMDSVHISHVRADRPGDNILHTVDNIRLDDIIDTDTT